MNGALSPERIGRFTASKFGVLMAEPHSIDVEALAHLVPDDIGTTVLKSGPRKGERTRVKDFNKLVREAARAACILPFTSQGRAYIKAKAAERVTGLAMDDAAPHTFGSRRGLMLEPGALYLLGDAWQKCHACTWQPYGADLGSTPDALVNGGLEPMDLKCPTNPFDVIDFGLSVRDGDFDSLLKWDAAYAWQIMVQALTCKSERAHLVYFTDKAPIIKMTTGARASAQALIDDAAASYSDQHGYPWSYLLASDGFFFVARSFVLTDGIRQHIEAVLERAAAERTRAEEEVHNLIKKAE